MSISGSEKVNQGENIDYLWNANGKSQWVFLDDGKENVKKKK